LVFKLEGTFGPAFAPEADGVGMKTDLGGSLDVGEFGLIVQEQGQGGALPQVCRRGAAALEQSCLHEELAGKARPVER
jgi:hypothetical protein